MNVTLRSRATREIIAIATNLNVCDANTVYDVPVGVPSSSSTTKVLNIVGRCPNASGRPTFYLQYKTPSEELYDFIYVKEGFLSTDIFQDGQTYDFRANWSMTGVGEILKDTSIYMEPGKQFYLFDVDIEDLGLNCP